MYLIFLAVPRACSVSSKLDFSFWAVERINWAIGTFECLSDQTRATAANKYCSLPKSHEHTADSYPGDDGRHANRPEATLVLLFRLFFVFHRCLRFLAVHDQPAGKTFRWKIDFPAAPVVLSVSDQRFHNFTISVRYERSVYLFLRDQPLSLCFSYKK